MCRAPSSSSANTVAVKPAGTVIPAAALEKLVESVDGKKDSVNAPRVIKPAMAIAPRATRLIICM